MTELSPDARYDFAFAVSDDHPVAWGLSHEAMEEALRQVDPQVDIDREHGHFWFAVTFPFGGVEGRITVDPDSAGLKLVDIDMAAQFVAWLRTRVLPAGSGIVFKTHEAIEMQYEPGVLPDSDDPEAIRAAMIPYIQNVETEYNA